MKKKQKKTEIGLVLLILPRYNRDIQPKHGKEMDQKTVYIDEEIHQEAKEMAQAEGKKLNFFITELVREAIEARKPVDLGDPMGSELPENDQITFQEQQETD